MRVNIISLLYILYHILHLRILSLSDHFVKAPPRPHLGSRSHEYLDFCIWEHSRANVSAIHYHTPPAAKLMQKAVDIFTDERNRRDRTHVTGNTHRANLLLHAAVSDVGSLRAEADFLSPKRLMKLLFVDVSIPINHPILHGM